jgi:hypothetical protein
LARANTANDTGVQHFDRLFPPELSTAVMPALKMAGVDADYFLLDSEYGHVASGAGLGEMGAAAEGVYGGVIALATTPVSSRRRPGRQLSLLQRR